MTRLIYADELMKYTHDVTLANGARHRCVDTTVIYAIPTVDAVPVSFIEAEIKRMEDEITIAFDACEDDQVIARVITRMATLKFMLAKWNHLCSSCHWSDCQVFDCCGCKYKRREE